MFDLLAYHADGETAHVANVAKIVGAIVVVAIGGALALRLPAERGRNRLARIGLALGASGLAGYVLASAADPSSDGLEVLGGGLFLVGFLAGPIVAAVGIARVRRSGEKWIAIAGLTASLLAVTIVIAEIVACGVTDACFH